MKNLTLMIHKKFLKISIKYVWTYAEDEYQSEQPKIPRRNQRLKDIAAHLQKEEKQITKQFLKCTSQSKKTKITQELLKIEKDLQKSFKDSKRYVENKAINSIKKNSKYFFAYVRKKAKVKTKIGPLLNANGELTQPSKEMAEILSRQYVTVFSVPKPENIMQDDSDEVNMDIIRTYKSQKMI